MSTPFIFRRCTLLMTKTQQKRARYDYRTNYFKRNPGLFGKIWFCSQCHKILIGRHNVQVDHIWALGAGGINRVFNTAAICAKCNRKKSDKMGLWLVNGLIGKFIELIIFRTRDLIKLVPKGILTVFSLIVGVFGWGVLIVFIGVIIFAFIR